MHQQQEVVLVTEAISGNCNEPEIKIRTSLNLTDKSGFEMIDDIIEDYTAMNNNIRFSIILVFSL